MSETRWVTLLKATHRIEAEIFKEALEAQGIPAEIFQDGIIHIYFNALGGGVDVCVPNDRLKEARAWLAEQEGGELRMEDLSEDENEEEDE